MDFPIGSVLGKAGGWVLGWIRGRPSIGLTAKVEERGLYFSLGSDGATVKYWVIEATVHNKGRVPVRISEVTVEGSGGARVQLIGGLPVVLQPADAAKVQNAVSNVTKELEGQRAKVLRVAYGIDRRRDFPMPTDWQR